MTPDEMVRSGVERAEQGDVAEAERLFRAAAEAGNVTAMNRYGVLLGKRGDDFGLAKAFDQAGLSGLTRTGTVAGKPWYVPRQQVINFRAASPAVDTWALAACLYQVTTGHWPREFPRGEDPWRVVLETPATPIRRHDPGIPRAIAEVIDHALQERPLSASKPPPNCATP
ncbi:hypothetical protein AB0L00_38445 [Actinoallomurus sp. NPDC052308]|uniref:hypothetical protein n=1 Tax=Actinoallomurus sp. NPDC052308 TaxID=3155530 RepID=UPI003436E360